ncbi:hypothetical protein BCR39DRAFT_567201 [Naematelia encephala]|uniref:Uncharacterized protein n=1 Tax=Naematelia encephala TaxID=71784 RepID=A0A1Y2AG47_9TREE|nr:hypothetical protein BCR39DRAFT_567201 [Naematelia encephala]
MAYIPEGQFDTLNAYLKTSNSPLYTQNGLEGQLAAQINTAFPLAASSGPTSSASDTAASGSSSTTRTRDIIIGVCVGIGGLLWVGLVYWIYKRVKRSNERAVHNRLSEHMSSMPGYGGPDRRVSRAPSIAASEVDDRPSSFYASPLDNDRFRGDYPRSSENPFGDGHESPTTYGPSVFGTSWFAQPKPNATTSRMSQNPFEEMVTRSFLTTSGSNGNLGSGLPQRRSTAGRRVEVQKGMISQPTLQTNSLEFREY